MVAVAVIAVNCAALRLLIANRRPDLALGTTAALGVLQLGLSRATGGRRPGRAFWLGSVAGGSLVLAPLLAHIYAPRSRLAAPLLVWSRLVHEPIEEVRNALFQGQPLAVHRVTGAVVFLVELPASVLFLSGAGGLMAHGIHRRLNGCE